LELSTYLYDELVLPPYMARYWKEYSLTYVKSKE
jgi:hypothetical protein